MGSDAVDNSGEPDANNLRQKWAMIYMLSNLWIAVCFVALDMFLYHCYAGMIFLYWYPISLFSILFASLQYNLILFLFGCYFIWKRRIKRTPAAAEMHLVIGTYYIFLVILIPAVTGMIFIATNEPQVLWLLVTGGVIFISMQVWMAYLNRHPRRFIAGYRFREISDDPAVLPLRQFAAANGVDNPRFALLQLPAGCDEAVNLYHATAKGPMFGFSQPVLDTLVGDEMLAAFAHELGHYKLRHVGKTRILKYAAFAMLTGLFFLMYVLMPKLPPLIRYEQEAADLMIDPAPMVTMVQFAHVGLYFILAGVVLMCLARPVAVYLSRRQETQANAWALRATGNPAAFISAMKKLAAKNKKAGRPSLLQKALFATHPPLDDVIRQGLDFAASQNISISETSQGDFC